MELPGEVKKGKNSHQTPPLHLQYSNHEVQTLDSHLSGGNQAWVEIITVNAFSSLESRTRSLQMLESHRYKKVKQEQSFLLQMHCHECLQLPQETKVLSANARFIPQERIKQEQKLECITMSTSIQQILILHAHTNKTGTWNKVQFGACTLFISVE